MDNSIITLCEELRAARETKLDLQKQIKEIDELISQLKEDLISAAVDQKIDQWVVGEYSYSLNSSFAVEKKCDSKELVRLFKLNQRSDIVTEYVNPRSLKTFVTEKLETNDQLPSWLLGAIIVKETKSLSVRKKT